MRPHISTHFAGQHLQRGISLLFALLSLVAMSLATLALVRSVGTGAQLLGNVGFKQDATASADQAMRQAIDWLVVNKGSLSANIPASGYYASSPGLLPDEVPAISPIDATGQQRVGTNNRQLVDWDGNGCSAAVSSTFSDCSVLTASAGSINGNAARYVVFRLCSKPGDAAVDTSISCTQIPPKSKSCGGSKGELKYGDDTLSCGGPGAYYRIVVRVLGARNTVSFAETIVQF